MVFSSHLASEDWNVHINIINIMLFKHTVSEVRNYHNHLSCVSELVGGFYMFIEEKHLYYIKCYIVLFNVHSLDSVVHKFFVYEFLMSIKFSIKLNCVKWKKLYHLNLQLTLLTRTLTYSRISTHKMHSWPIIV